MKAVFIFNQLNDIVFMHYDEAFRRHVLAKATDVGLAEEADSGGPFDPNIAMQMFAMVVASQRFMTEQVHNSYQSILCENDFLFVMEQYHDQILMAINGDTLETEDFMRRKLLVLQKILRFFFGPCDEEVRREKLHERNARWRFIAQVLDTWVDLYNTEQSFLVEAVERLHVNQLLNAKCIQLLEKALGSVRAPGGERGAVHALLTVNAKLLSLYSLRSAYELFPSDLLLLIVLARTQFPSRQRLEDFFSTAGPACGPGPEGLSTPTDTEPYVSAREERAESAGSEEFEFYSSIPSTPARSPHRGSPSNEGSAPQQPSSMRRGHPREVLTRVQKVLGDQSEDPSVLLKMYYPPFDRRSEDRSNGDRVGGDQGSGDWGGGDRGGGDRGGGDRGGGDRGGGDRGGGDRGGGDRGGGDRGGGDRGGGDRGGGDRGGGDRGGGDRGRGDRGRGDRGRGDRGGGDRARGDRARGDRARGDRGRADRGRADRGRADRGRGDRGRADRGRGDRGRGDRVGGDPGGGNPGGGNPGRGDPVGGDPVGGDRSHGDRVGGDRSRGDRGHGDRGRGVQDNISWTSGDWNSENWIREDPCGGDRGGGDWNGGNWGRVDQDGVDRSAEDQSHGDWSGGNKDGEDRGGKDRSNGYWAGSDRGNGDRLCEDCDSKKRSNGHWDGSNRSAGNRGGGDRGGGDQGSVNQVNKDRRTANCGCACRDSVDQGGKARNRTKWSGADSSCTERDRVERGGKAQGSITMSAGDWRGRNLGSGSWGSKERSGRNRGDVDRGGGDWGGGEIGDWGGGDWGGIVRGSGDWGGIDRGGEDWGGGDWGGADRGGGDLGTGDWGGGDPGDRDWGGGDWGGGERSGATWDDRDRVSVEQESCASRFTVMLGTPQCKYTPHSVHCIEVMPGITLIIIAEVSRTKLSGTICQTVSVLRAVLHKESVTSLQGKQTLDFIDSNLKKILDMMKRVKAGGHVDRLLEDTWRKWEVSKRSGLLAYLDSSDNTLISSRLEATLSSVLDRLKELFRTLYLSPHPEPPEAQLALSQVIEYCQALMAMHLYDYKEYLAVKSQRNITMTNFVEDFPGLIHFIYVDRSMHQMTAPSINVVRDSGPGKVDTMAIIKAKLWSKVPHIQRRLKKGHLTQVLRDGDFLYSYFLWFEDASGHPVANSVPYDGVEEKMLPGILAGGFYRQLARQVFPSGPLHGAVRCYELFMLHIGVLPTHFVLRQGHKLAARMWETTGEANSPMTLL